VTCWNLTISSQADTFLPSQLADRTIFEMQQQLDAKDQSLKAQAALIAELRKEVTEKDQIITKQKSDLETLKEKVERMTSGSASPST